MRGDDRVGAVAELLERLGAAKINVSAIDALCVADGRYGAIFWVAPKDVKKARGPVGRLIAAADRLAPSHASTVTWRRRTCRLKARWKPTWRR